MPSRPPVRATVHSKIDEGDYTVESVFFESSPGLFVTGSLYRPAGPSLPTNLEPGLPAVLCPYGHWNNGRFYEQGSEDGAQGGASGTVAEQIKIGAEDFEQAGRAPLQARCVGLARLGCVVFMYDMLGRADGADVLSDGLIHGFGNAGSGYTAADRAAMATDERWGLYSPQAEHRLISTMGLFTWNSIRSLDWISGLDDVDPERIGCTGASGGGTQTFILAAVDERISAAFPCVMAGCAMQGGCSCENCSLLRIGTGNIEICATIAPRPLGLTGANDWTVAVESAGLPELKEIYQTLGAPSDSVEATYLDFEHNYNARSRDKMYRFFNQHLELGHDESALAERDFRVLSPEELTVWRGHADSRPTPSEEAELTIVRAIAADNEAQMAALAPAERLEVARQAFATMLTVDPWSGHQRLPWSDEVLDELDTPAGPMPVSLLAPTGPANQIVVVLANADGPLAASAESATAAELRAAGFSVLALELPLAGAEQAPRMGGHEYGTDRDCASFTHCYNASLFAQRASALGAAVRLGGRLSFGGGGPQSVLLLGLGGTNAALACAACALAAPGSVAGLAVDTEGFRFSTTTLYDPNFLPGAVKYGDMPTLLALTAPTPLWLAGEATLNSHLTLTMQRTKVFMPPPFREGPEGKGGASVVRQYFGDEPVADVLEWAKNATAGSKL